MAKRRARTAGEKRAKKARKPRKPKRSRKQVGPLIIDRVAPAALLEAKRKTREALQERERNLTFMTLLGRESNWVAKAVAR